MGLASKGPDRSLAARRCPGVWSVLAFLCALLVAAPAARAQNAAVLQGRIMSATGTPVVGAQVGVLNRETGQQHGTVTTGSGAYTVVGLEPGAYHLTVRMIGYQQQERDVTLLVGQRATLDFRLAESAVALQGVEVVSQAEPTFEVQRSDVSTPVVQAEIENLPLNSRNTMNLAAIVPGMKTFAPTAGRSLPASGSLPDLRFWNFYLDGAEWKSMFNGNLVGIPQTGSPIPQEAVREFRVHLNPYDAQYTRGASFVISAVTYRGTNEFHGSAFAYGQNNSLNALDMFQRQAKAADPAGFERADYKRAQAGFNLRGPIVKDKLFFSASYEYQNTDNTIAVIPGRPSYDPDIWNQYAGSVGAPTKNQNGVLRLTAPVGSDHTLDAVWASRFYDSETNFGGTATRDAGIRAKYQVHSVQLRDTYAPSASFANELSLNLLYWNHNESPLVPGPTLSYPGITFGTSGFPLELKETHVRLLDHATYTVADGKHILTGGVELARVRTNSWLPSNRDGFFQFRTDTSSEPFLGRIGVGFYDANSAEDARAVTNGTIVGAYAQDRWQVVPNFELTLGLRYDAEINTLNNDFTVPWASDPALSALPELQGFLNQGNRKNDLDNIAPRASFSWDLFGNNKTYVRGGAGIMYDRIATFMAFFERQSAGWRTYEFANPGTTDPEALRQMVISGGGTSTPSMNLMKVDMKTPYNIQSSIGIGQQLAPRLALNVDYIHQDARNLYVQISQNPLDTQTGQRTLTDDYGTITLYDDFGRAKFDAVATSLTYDKPGLRASLAYTLGWYRAQMEGLGSYVNSTFFLMQPTTGDERHRVVLSGIGDLPYDFKLSAVAILATPRPYVATVGQDVNHDNNFNDDFVGGNGNRTVTPATNWENMYRTVDLRLTKSFSMGGERKFSVSAEAFNIFNWDNYSGFFGRAADASGSPFANFGQASGVYAPRQAQLGVRYDF
ncbi:MAG TPA: carboxypeptidase regulatory-like domain-containing protein [Gemmatimonadaceae bacterium]